MLVAVIVIVVIVGIILVVGAIVLIVFWAGAMQTVGTGIGKTLANQSKEYDKKEEDLQNKELIITGTGKTKRE